MALALEAEKDRRALPCATFAALCALHHFAWELEKSRSLRSSVQAGVSALLCPKNENGAARLPQTEIAELPRGIIPSPGLLTKRGASQKSCGGVRWCTLDMK